ncbi:hypothetical protein, partial [Porphyromonas loveana]|uniref:hypothetical protein n=1 Tax=Porphyromonas loveana TaxID=1884669 RepID=UPI0035A0224E
FGWWTENVSTRLAGWGAVMAEKYKLEEKKKPAQILHLVHQLLGVMSVTISSNVLSVDCWPCNPLS